MVLRGAGQAEPRLDETGQDWTERERAGGEQTHVHHEESRLEQGKCLEAVSHQRVLL